MDSDGGVWAWHERRRIPCFDWLDDVQRRLAWYVECRFIVLLPRGLMLLSPKKWHYLILFNNRNRYTHWHKNFPLLEFLQHAS